MERHDALVCPVASVQPFDKTELFPREIDGRPLPTYISWIAITYGLTLVGHPVLVLPCGVDDERSEEHTSDQSLMRTSYAVFCLTKKTDHPITHTRRFTSMSSSKL